ILMSSVSIDLAILFDYRPEEGHQFLATLFGSRRPVFIEDVSAVVLVELRIAGKNRIHSSEYFLPSHSVDGNHDDVSLLLRENCSGNEEEDEGDVFHGRNYCISNLPISGLIGEFIQNLAFHFADARPRPTFAKNFRHEL